MIPGVSSLIMALAVWLLYQPLHKVIGVRISTLLCLILAVIIYAFSFCCCMASQRKN